MPQNISCARDPNRRWAHPRPSASARVPTPLANVTRRCSPPDISRGKASVREPKSQSIQHCIACSLACPEGRPPNTRRVSTTCSSAVCWWVQCRHRILGNILIANATVSWPTTPCSGRLSHRSPSIHTPALRGGLQTSGQCETPWFCLTRLSNERNNLTGTVQQNQHPEPPEPCVLGLRGQGPLAAKVLWRFRTSITG